MIVLSIIIVSYNTCEFLKKCVNSIKESNIDLKTIQVIIVDNASYDNSVQEVLEFRKSLKNLKIIKNKENVGFSKANNIGLKECNSELVLFLNPDTVLYPNTLGRMIDFMKITKDAGAATCWVELPDGELDDASHRGFPTPFNALFYFTGISKVFPKMKLFSGYNLTWMDFAKIHEIDVCAGAFIILRKNAGEEINWWDEDYFWYGEDIDLCYRLKQRGWKIYFVPDVKILHYKGVSGGIKQISKEVTTANKKTRIKATKARFEAMSTFYKKHYIYKYPKFLTWIIMKGIYVKQWLALKSLL